MRAILIAAKALAFAKTRLAKALPPATRIELAQAMFHDVLSAAMSAPSARQVAVISSDPTLLQAARQAGAMPIDEEFPRGLNVAVRLATTALRAVGAHQVCTLLSDIPLITSEDVEAALAAGEEPGVVLVPSRDLTGTNLMVRTPPDVIATRFGSQSLARHLEECRRLDIPCQVIKLARPSIDLDVLDDLIEFMRVPNATHTFNQLARLGLAPA